MANKQPLMDHGHESRRWTDSLQSIESKIHKACCKNETQKVNHFLLRRKNDINAKKLDGFGSFLVAIGNHNFLIVDGLLGIGCNPNAANLNGKPLLLAIDRCNLEIVKLLLKHNANPNPLNDKGYTPLYLAVTKGHIKIVKELLNNGAEVDKRSLGVTPFSNAIITNPFNIPKILLEYGADVDAIIDSPWFEGRTSLQIASYVGRLKNVEFLLEHNANINAVDNNKCTPLHLATLANKTKVVNLLLSSGGNDLNIRNEEGNTALESAIAKNHIKVTKMISFHESF